MIGDGRVYRFKQVVDKEWMTLWGKVVVPRRLYQGDRADRAGCRWMSAAGW